jgi:hypothetical protein
MKGQREDPSRSISNNVAHTGWADGSYWQIVLQKSKVAGDEFFVETRNGKQSPIRITSIALPKSPVSLT